MNACVTLMMGLAALGYQPFEEETAPLPAPAAEGFEEEVAPAPLPSPVAPPKVPVESPQVDVFAPEATAPAPQPFTVPPTGLTYDDPPLSEPMTAFDSHVPFHPEPALVPIPMEHHPVAGPSACQCGHAHSCDKPSRHGCCLGKLCENSTCDMPPHFPYFPAHHGYYDFRPYNYTHIAEHQALITTLGGDPRAPYSTADFARYYQTFPSGAGEFPPFEPALRPLPHLSRQLPNLEALLHNPAAP